MEHCWDIYENMHEVVYVVDMDTYEVVYLNKFGRDNFGISSVEALAGRPCHSVLQGNSSPCSICTNDRLRPGQFYEWRHYNGLLDKTYLIKDTMIIEDGRRLRLEITIDVSESERQKKAIEEFTSNELLVNDALRLSLAEETPEKSIEVLLRHLGQSLRSDRVYIFEGVRGGVVSNTYEWCASGVEPQKDALSEVPFEVVSLWYEAFDRNENIIIKGLETIKESDPRVYETLLPQEVDTLVVSPIIMDDEIIGFYGVDNPPSEFLNHISVMFMVLGYFIGSILKRRNLVEHLERLSFYDQLTGALNRHGMNEFIANVDHEASIGIVYCDIMGLKRVNDTEGHLAGDALLARAYEMLCEIFPKKSIFRIGGDEFLVLGSNVSREEFDRCNLQLKQKMPDGGITFAVGSVWEEACRGRITELMKIADKRMYEDKAEYYRSNPAFCRRANRG